MTSFIYYILTVIGIGYFITSSDLMKPFRMAVSKLNKDLDLPFKWIVDKFDGVINCIYCCSFWLGIGVYYGMFIPESSYIFYPFSVMCTIYVIKNIFPK